MDRTRIPGFRVLCTHHYTIEPQMRPPGIEPESKPWKGFILTIGLQTLPSSGFEPEALALLAPRSNQLSYEGSRTE